jgi:hypothetical protein
MSIQKKTVKWKEKVYYTNDNTDTQLRLNVSSNKNLHENFIEIFSNSR